MKGKFLEGCQANGLDTTKAEKVWRDWEAFASYAFNKSHSTCYALLAMQTGYLKAHYPAEFMAATLTHNMRDIKDVSFFLEECRRLKIKVLGPDVNESEYHFTVNQNGEIRFGMGAIKGVGEGAVDAIVTDRKTNGLYTSIFDLCKRIDSKAANKKTLEGLAYAGAFDSFQVVRSAYFHEETEGNNLLGKAIKYGNSVKEEANSLQASLFGDDTAVELKEPDIPKVEEWPLLHKLNQEKQVVGLFISGHPLNQFERDLKYFVRYHISDVTNDQLKAQGKELLLAGIVSKAEHRISKNGNGFGQFEVEDFYGSARFTVFGEEYLKFKHLMTENTYVLIKGRFEKRFEGADIEFRVKFMDMLENLRKNSTKSMDLVWDAMMVNNELVDEMYEKLSMFKGKVPVKITVIDNIEKIRVDLTARQLMVDPSNELMDELEKMPLEEVLLNA
jgi:DNA polymerase-3 subunit alpha